MRSAGALHRLWTHARSRPQVLIFAAIVAAALFAMAPVLVGAQTFVLRDHLTLILPSRRVLAEALRAGHLPEWWNGVGLGMPFAANPLHLVFYPPAWLAAALPMPFGADALIFMHLVLGGFGTALLSRRLGACPRGAALAGVLFVLSGYASSMLVLGAALFSLAWLPWLAWAADRIAHATQARAAIRCAAGFAMCVAGIALAGDPAGAVTGGVLAIIVVCIRARSRETSLALLLAGLVVGLLLAAVLLVPAAHLLGPSERGFGTHELASDAWSMHPWQLLELLVPDALGDPTWMPHDLARLVSDAGASQRTLASSWALSLFLGAPTLVLVLAAMRRDRRACWLAAASLLFVVLALGAYTPVYRIWRTGFVVEQLFRYPARHLAGAIVIWLALAGVGATRMLGAPLSRRSLVQLLALLASAAAVLAVYWMARGTLASGWSARAAAMRPAVEVDAALARADAGALLAFGSLVAFTLGFAVRRRARRASTILIVAALVAPPALHARTLQPLVARERIECAPELLPAPSDHGAVPMRIYRSFAALLDPARARSLESLTQAMYDTSLGNLATRFGFATVPGIDPAASSRLAGLFAALSPRLLPQVLARFGVRYAILTPFEVGDSSLQLRRRSNTGYGLYELATARQRAFVAPRSRTVASDAEALEAFAGDAGRDLGLVHLAGAQTGSIESSSGVATDCSLRAAVPEQLSIECDAPAAGVLVVLEAWAPGWTATVDGAAADVVRADVLVMAVRLPAGRHRVELVYETPGLRLGALLSGLGLVLLAGTLLVVRVRPRDERLAGLQATALPSCAGLA